MNRRNAVRSFLVAAGIILLFIVLPLVVGSLLALYLFPTPQVAVIRIEGDIWGYYTDFVNEALEEVENDPAVRIDHSNREFQIGARLDRRILHRDDPQIMNTVLDGGAVPEEGVPGLQCLDKTTVDPQLDLPDGAPFGRLNGRFEQHGAPPGDRRIPLRQAHAGKMREGTGQGIPHHDKLVGDLEALVEYLAGVEHPALAMGDMV